MKIDHNGEDKLEHPFHCRFIKEQAVESTSQTGISLHADVCSDAILRSKSIIQMAMFRKQEDCPPSQQLLAYQLGDLESDAARPIGRHLSACEFCSSEVGFYERYPVSREAEESPSETSMPKPLFDLAEALLNRERGKESMDKIMEQLDTAVHDRH